jgi:hypothetical protein
VVKLKKIKVVRSNETRSLVQVRENNKISYAVIPNNTRIVDIKGNIESFKFAMKMYKSPNSYRPGASL